MKKLILIFIFLRVCILQAQDYDTTAVADTVIEINSSIVFESDFTVYDTSNYDESGNAEWLYSIWENYDRGDTTIYEQFRISDIGIRERRIQKVLYTQDTIVVHSYSSKMKERDENN